MGVVASVFPLTRSIMSAKDKIYKDSCSVRGIKYNCFIRNYYTYKFCNFYFVFYNPLLVRIKRRRCHLTLSVAMYNSNLVIFKTDIYWLPVTSLIIVRRIIINNLVHTTRFLNIFYPVHSNTKRLESQIIKMYLEARKYALC